MKLRYIAAIAAMMVTGAVSTANAITFSTSDSQFDAGVNNQGWWSATRNALNTVDNYFTGTTDSDMAVLRSFFTFDLGGGVLAGQTVTGATLRLQRFLNNPGNDLTETIEFFDVSTDAATLNNNAGTSAPIFADLGTGTSYGSFSVPGFAPFNSVAEFNLNAAAIADINAAIGGFFSIGGSLISNEGDDAIFSLSDAGIQELVLTTDRPIPEPGTLALFSLGLAGLAAARRRKAA